VLKSLNLYKKIFEAKVAEKNKRQALKPESFIHTSHNFKIIKQKQANMPQVLSYIYIS
jgi:hypothetical protein